MIRFILLITGLLGFTCLAWSQQDTTTVDDDLDETIEDVIVSTETDGQVDYTFLTDKLEEYRKRPINLNEASKDELLTLPGITDIIAIHLLDYVERFGDLTTLYELQAVEGFSQEVINQIIPYCTVDRKAKDISPGGRYPAGPPLSEILTNVRGEFIQRLTFTLEEELGYTDPDTTLRYTLGDAGDTLRTDTSLSTRYLGSPYRLYSRLRFRYGQNFSAAITGEKDPGEVFKFAPSERKYGYDYLSAHIAIRNYGKLRALVLGDYTVQFGQGMTLSRGLGFGKGAEVISSVKMPAVGIQPYASVNESQYLRGAAATYAIGDLQMTGFFSSVRSDASAIPADTAVDAVSAISSIQISGLHRTPSEIAGRRSIQETFTGGHIALVKRRLNIGSSFFIQNFGSELNPTPNAYNQFDLRGASNYITSLDWDLVVRNFNIFGEVARSKSGGIGATAGFMASLAPTLDLSMVVRSFDIDFHSYRAFVFAERPTAAQNERGLYMGVRIKPNPKWILSGYFDQYYFPWNKFLSSYPSRGNEIMSQIEYIPQRGTQFYLRYRVDKRERNATDYSNGQQVEYLVPVTRNNFRLHFQSNMSRTFTVRSRLELSWYQQAEEAEQKGFLLYQDLVWKPGFKFKVTGRYALFDAPDYNARIYAYENDILGFFSIPPYYRTGSRYYLVFNYKASRSLEFWLRFAQTRLHKIFLSRSGGSAYLPESNRGDISITGLETIIGNTDSEVKLQMRINF